MTATHVKRAFRYRFRPTDAQAAEPSRTFGCVREVHTMALAARTEAWARQKRVNHHRTSAMLTAWKKSEELAYVNEVSSVPLRQALRHLRVAFTNLFGKRATYPRFRSRRKSRRSAEYTTSAFTFRDGRRTRARMSGPPEIVWSRPLPEGAAPSTVTRRKVAKVHARITDRCRDHLHKLTTRPVRENQTTVIEDLSVRNTVKNHFLARAVSDAAWQEFRSMVEYKAAWYGRDVVAIDRFFPSSRLSSTCGAPRSTMPLSVRTWTCDCGTTRDRDVNAARDVLAVGLTASVCGAGVRPQRRTPGGQSATKQKHPRREP